MNNDPRDSTPSPPPSPPASPTSPGDAADETVKCPKCGREARATESACARCGLMVTRFRAFATLEQRQAGKANVLDEPWATCTAAWHESLAHDRLLEVAKQLGQLPALARRYREVFAKEADPVAEKRLKQISILLEHALRAEARESASSTSTRAVWVFGYLVTAAVLAASVWVFLTVFRNR